jgi:hypothetical protein
MSFCQQDAQIQEFADTGHACFADFPDFVNASPNLLLLIRHVKQRLYSPVLIGQE